MCIRKKCTRCNEQTNEQLIRILWYQVLEYAANGYHSSSTPYDHQHVARTCTAVSHGPHPYCTRYILLVLSSPATSSFLAFPLRPLVRLLPADYLPWCVSVFLFIYFLITFFYFPAQLVGGFYLKRSSGQAVVTGVVPSPRYVPSIFIAHRVQHSHCSSIFIECCSLTLSRFPLIIFLSQEKVTSSTCTR